MMSICCELAAVILMLALHGEAMTIIGGHEVVPHSRPYMALLKKGDQNQYCGGFLLSQDFVMTAAHCEAEYFTVFLGVHDASKRNEAQTIVVDQAFPNKNYNNISYINDVMLLQLKTKAKITDKVRPIEIADWNDVSLPKSCSISGWGRADWQNKYMSNLLGEVNVTLTTDHCNNQHVYCSREDSGPGKGDSGGPLVCENGQAFGVVSSCLWPVAGAPPLCKYTKIQKYMDWITYTISSALKNA